MALHIGDIFSSVEVARDAINRFILDSGESYYMKETSNKRQYSVTCRTQSSGCKFSIRCGLQKDGNARVSKMSPHTCNPRTHYKFKQLSSLWYLLPHHRASISHNREISVAQIRANEKEQWANDINYMAAYRTRRDCLQKDPTLTDSTKKGFDARYAISRRWRILSCNSLKVEVINESGKEFVVDLIDRGRSCSCGRYVEYYSPCTHAIVAARYLHIDPYSLFGHYYTIFCYRLTYQTEIPPLLSQGLKMDDMLPPLVIQKRGRPQKQRLRKRVQKQSKQIRCSNPWCRQLGHNKRKCTTTQKEGIAIDRNFGYDAEISALSEVSSDEAESGIIAESPIVLPLRRSQRQRGL
jgi:hypothetical protein